MKDQINTIREALEQAKQNTTHGQIAWNCKEALAALAQIEASVAQQYEAGDVASAAGQGFRDGAASVAQQPQYPLPDDLYPDSKDWMAGTYAERVEWLHRAYESQRELVAEYERQLAQQPQAEAVPLPPQVMVDMVPPATARDRWMYEQGRLAERDPRTHAAPQQAEAVPSDAMVMAGARMLNQRAADATGINVDDQWNFFAEQFKDDARAVLVAAIAQQKGQP